MRIESLEDRDEYVDLVAQAVIDKIEERDRIEGMVNLVVARVLALQKEQAQAAAVLAEAPAPDSLNSFNHTSPEETHVTH